MANLLGVFIVKVSLAFFAFAIPLPRSGTSSEQITYLSPIWEGALASHDRNADLAVLSTMKSQLGVGGTYTKLGWSFSSWALSRDIYGSYNDYNFDPTNFNYMLDLGVTSNLPVLVHMNNGRWADCCTPNSSGGWGDTLLDHIAAQPDTTVLDSSGRSCYSHNGGQNFFSLSRLNDVYRSYKKRNIQASANVIANWASLHPELFVGVSLDSETLMANNGADYNPHAIDEWKEWLQNTGIYGPGGDYFGAGRIPVFKSINDFNAAIGQSFASWDAMQPPRGLTPGDSFSEEWERWRIMLINHAVADETLWIASAGIANSLIFGHQTPRMDDYSFADDVQTATAANGAGGVTYYGWDPANFGEMDNVLRGSGSNNFGIFELNPLTTDPTRAYNTLVTLYNDGVKVICPNSWEDDNIKDQYALMKSPNYGDTFGDAVNKFLSDYGNSPRNLQPPPWNPGTKIFDLYDNFPTATSTGADNHLDPSLSVGSVVQKSIYAHVGSVITYHLTLPSITPGSGQRLNFHTFLGIRDGAGPGGEAVFQATINGANLFGRGFHLNKNYWHWKRWVPMMVDITPWAGNTVSLQLTATGNEVWGWTVWGAPGIYASSGANLNLALGRSVTTSSSAGQYEGWDERFVTDGSMDSSTGRKGWSSSSHTSAENTEWARIDLGSSQSVGKVVLFPRADLVDFSGTGFPSSFQIQGSNDGNNWTTLVNLVDYSGAKAGEGQVFTFLAQDVKLVQVLGTVLGGVGTEFGYRMQLAEIEVYA